MHKMNQSETLERESESDRGMPQTCATLTEDVWGHRCSSKEDDCSFLAGYLTPVRNNILKEGIGKLSTSWQGMYNGHV